MSEPDNLTLGPDPRSNTRAKSVATPPPTDVAAGGAQPMPSIVGRYRILRLLGEGGMGAVYEAEQDLPHRTVALKVIRVGYANIQMLRRFETETQALGRLQHPGIAQIYDAGTAETPYGRQPYIAMELVVGQTLLAWCDEHQLTMRGRLELMAKICDAVQHAHQRGLIHRDLKPANILVSEDGQPKILDFGIARLTDADTQATRQTSMGQIIGTLAYMSPEQVTGDPDEVDTRSDVYTLGVILYELIAGKPPYEIGKQIHETMRTIREKEPIALRTVNRTFRGDIETIAAKALEKEKTRRYGSAAELAADIRHYLHDEPIVARPASASYQIHKFARRHKALVGGIAAVFAVLVLGVVASTWEAVQARRAQKRAQQETAVAQAVNDFLQKDLLGQASAYNQTKPDPNITVRTVLDQAALRIAGKFNGQPEVEAAIRGTIGTTYAQLGIYPQAEQQLNSALALSRSTLGPDNPQTLAIMSGLGRLAYLRGRYAESKRWFRGAWNAQQRVLGAENRATLYSMSNLAVALEFEGKYAEAEPLYTRALGIERRVLGPDDPDTLNTTNGLAGLYVYEGKYPRAEVLHRELVAELTRVRGADYPDTLRSVNNLAALLSKEGKLGEAEALDRQLVEARQRVLGPNHPDTLYSMANLASMYNQEGKYSEAEQLDRQVLTVDLAGLGPENPSTLQAMQILAGVCDNEGKLDESAALRERIFDIRKRILGPEHPLTLGSESDLANNYAFQGNYAKAESLYRAVMQADRRVIGADNPEILPAMDGLACTLREEGNYLEAIKLFQEALALSIRVLGPLHPNTLGITSDFGFLYQKHADFPQATRYYQLAFEGMRGKFGPQSPATANAEADFALAYVSEKKFAQAEPLALEALATDRKVQPDDWQRYRAEALLGESFFGQNKLAEAEPLLRGGYHGMLFRKDHIDAPDEYHLNLAHRWFAQLHHVASHQGPVSEQR